MKKIITDSYAIEFESGYDSLIKIIGKKKYSYLYKNLELTH